MTKWIPWVLRALWSPVEQLDLYDRSGKPDHSKIVPFLFLVSAVAAHFLAMPFAWWELLALGSLSFGYGAWRQFMATKAVSGTLEEKISRSYVSPLRDAEAGVDPTTF